MSAQIQNSTDNSGNYAGSSGVWICQVHDNLPSHFNSISLTSSRNGNPYHNNLHAADVLQTTNWFITQAGFKVNILTTGDSEGEVVF